MNSWDEVEFVQQGWQCPKCHRIYSPSTPMCFYCYQEEPTNSYSIETTTTKNPLGSPVGPCDRVCDNKTSLGYCKTTVCTNPEYNKTSMTKEKL